MTQNPAAYSARHHLSQQRPYKEGTTEGPGEVRDQGATGPSGSQDQESSSCRSDGSQACGDRMRPPSIYSQESSTGSTGLSQASRAVRRRQQRSQSDSTERMIMLMEAGAQTEAEDRSRLLALEEGLLRSQQAMVEQGNTHINQFGQALLLLGQNSRWHAAKKLSTIYCYRVRLRLVVWLTS